MVEILGHGILCLAFGLHFVKTLSHYKNMENSSLILPHIIDSLKMNILIFFVSAISKRMFPPWQTAREKKMTEKSNPSSSSTWFIPLSKIFLDLVPPLYCQKIPPRFSTISKDCKWDISHNEYFEGRPGNVL